VSAPCPSGDQYHSFGDMPSPVQRARGWCFTLNNYGELHELMLRRLRCQYLVYGREVGESGTPHLQGYVYFSSARTMSQVRKLIPHAHLSVRGGSHQQASDYCKKDGDFEEIGVPPADGLQQRRDAAAATASKWKEINDHAQRGDMDWIKDNFPKEYVVHKPRLESLYAPETHPLDGELLHEWWIGPTGSGKSRLLWELYPKHFAKNINKWWDGYRFEGVVAIEEWSPENAVTAQSLKKWADRYPFPGEIKGGTLQHLRPRKIIVLSNYSIEECFPRAADLGPIQRRFKVIEFPGGVQHARFRAAWFNAPAPEDEVTAMSIEDTDASDTSTVVDEDLPYLDLDFLYSQGE